MVNNGYHGSPFSRIIALMVWLKLFLHVVNYNVVLLTLKKIKSGNGLYHVGPPIYDYLWWVGGWFVIVLPTLLICTLGKSAVLTIKPL